MSDEIRADYEELEEVARQFANEANEIEQMLRNYHGRYVELRDGGWLGLGVEAFKAEMEDEVIPATVRFYRALNEANQVTREIISSMRQSEEEAASLFKAI